MAARSGVAVSAIHFYEAKGLIRSRGSGQSAPLSARDLAAVAVIKVAQRIGIPLATIHEALATLPDGRIPTAADWRRLSAVWKRGLDDRIERLLRLRDSPSAAASAAAVYP